MNPFTRLPKFVKNYYFLFGLFFVSWMLFVDSNDFISQYRLSRKLDRLEQEKAYYIEKKVLVTNDKEELTSDKDLLEKFARENYLMKRPSEDVYVVVEND